MADDQRPLSGALEGLRPNLGVRLGQILDPEPTRPLFDAPTPFPTFDLPDFEADDSPRRTAENTEAMTEHMAALTAVMREQAALVAEQVALSTETLQTAEQAERRANRIGWISLAVAVASLGTSIGALFAAG